MLCTALLSAVFFEAVTCVRRWHTYVAVVIDRDAADVHLYPVGGLGAGREGLLLARHRIVQLQGSCMPPSCGEGPGQLVG